MPFLVSKLYIYINIARRPGYINGKKREFFWQITKYYYIFANFAILSFAIIEKITSEMVLYQQNFRSTDKQNDAKNCDSLS